MKVDLMELALWMVAVELRLRGSKRLGLVTPESEFYAAWWNSVDDATNGEAWRLARVYHADLIS